MIREKKNTLKRIVGTDGDRECGTGDVSAEIVRSVERKFLNLSCKPFAAAPSVVFAVADQP